MECGNGIQEMIEVVQIENLHLVELWLAPVKGML